MAIKTFTTGEVLTASDTNTYLANAGLDYITGTTFSGSTATYIRLVDCFNSKYDNYRIVFSNMRCNVDSVNVVMYFDYSGSSTNYYGGTRVAYVGGAITSQVATGSGGFLIGLSSGDMWDSVVDVTNVRTANWKGLHSVYSHDANSGQANGQDRSTTVRAGFDVITLAGVTQFNSGSIRIYGYRQA